MKEMISSLALTIQQRTQPTVACFIVPISLICSRSCFAGVCSIKVQSTVHRNQQKLFPSANFARGISTKANMRVADPADSDGLSSNFRHLSLDGSSETPKFAIFKEQDGKQTLLLKFAEDLLSCSHKNDGMRRFFEAVKPTFAKASQSSERLNNQMSKDLLHVLGQNVESKNELRYTAAYNTDLDTYVLTFSSRSDELLVRYAHKFQFPRGCPVLWKPGSFIDIRGFYPKFDNDNRIEAGFDTNILKDSSQIDFFLKWSGFLIQLFAFQINDQYYWSVFSKQKADYNNPFVQLGKKIMQPHMTCSLVKELADNHLYIGAEGLSPQDNTHGYIASAETAVVTCVGQGTYASLLTKENIFFESRIVHYFTNCEIVEFCRKHCLKCDTARQVRGDYALLSDFTKLLFRRRDFMKFQDFERSFEEFHAVHPTQCVIHAGSANHQTFVGDVLEGMVFAIKKNDGTITTKKVKLPFYTWRTMFLRNWFDALIDRKRNLQGKAVGVVKIRELKFVTPDALKRMETFTQYWCSTAEGKKYFMQLMKAAAVLLQRDGQLVIDGSTFAEITEDLHVHLANNVEQLSTGALKEMARCFDEMLPPALIPHGPPIACCFVLGPIGSGKSTFSEKLQAECIQHALHIDGDRVVRNGMTNFLHAERSDASKSAIYKCILAGNHPIFSTGGGVFDGYEVQERLTAIFNRPVKVIVCIMTDIKNVKSGKEKYEIVETSLVEIEQELPQIFDTDLSYMQRVVAGRVARKDWPETKEYAKINEKSRNNAKYASQLMKQADHIFKIPYDTSPEFHESPHLVVSTKVSGIHKVAKFLQYPLETESGALSGKFTQIRAVVSRSEPGRGATCKHITLEYNEKTFQADHTIYQKMEEQLCAQTRTFSAETYHLTGKSEKDKKTESIKVSIFPEISIVPYAHVTEFSGPFKPALMKDVTKHLQDVKIAQKEVEFKLAKPGKNGEIFSFRAGLPVNEPKNKTGVKRTDKSHVLQKMEKLKYDFVEILLI